MCCWIMRLSVGVILLFEIILAIPRYGNAADDLSDGISEATDESIAGDDSMGNKDTNISFIVQDAIAKSKMIKKTAGGDQASNDKVNYSDEKTVNNENSIVLEPGSRADKIYNIIIEK